MMILSDGLTAHAWGKTPDLIRAEAMGFSMTSCIVSWTGEALEMSGQLLCVCGRIENFKFNIEVPRELLDPAKLLRLHGAFSKEHLVSDGYSAIEIASILSKGESHDVESK